ncbi:MAG: hypothetical protein ACE5HJ_07905 [Thermoplasmata archaeon]
MGENVALFDMVNAGTRQRVNHAHIMDDAITLHWHNLEAEPEEEEGITLSTEDWVRIMTPVYWKREETIEAKESEGVNLISAEVRVGYVVFRYRQGKKKVEEEISVLSLRQVDGRLRKRHR